MVDVVTWRCNMASLIRLPNSPYWIACFARPDGTRTQRSTKCTDRGEALRVALAFQDASTNARAGRLLESQARRVISDILRVAGYEPLTTSTIESFLKGWLRRKEDEISQKSHVRYAVSIHQFILHLGGKARLDLCRLRPADILASRDSLEFSRGFVLL